MPYYPPASSSSNPPVTTVLLDNVAANGSYAGPTPPTNWTGSFTASGSGTVLIFASCAAVPNGVGRTLTVNLKVDGATIASVSRFFNNDGMHGEMPSLMVETTLSAGAHTIELTLTGTGAAADFNDYARLTVTEFP